MSRVVFLRWKGRKSVFESPRVQQAVRDGLLDEEDLWADEQKRVPGMPYVDMRMMGSVNHVGQETETKLERVYQWGPLPWDMVQKVLESDARIILASSARKEFELVRAATYAEAQDLVLADLIVPFPEVVDREKEFVVKGYLTDALNSPMDKIEELKLPIGD